MLNRLFDISETLDIQDGYVGWIVAHDKARMMWHNPRLESTVYVDTSSMS